MAHSFANCRFGLVQKEKRSCTALTTSYRVGKWRLWVAKRRVSFQTRSIGLSSGLYGGKNNSVSRLRCLRSQGRSARAWWYLALSSTRTRRLLRERCLSRVFRKRWKDSPLNFGSKAVTNLPVRTLAAPKHATDLRVGACSRTGSLSSGGIHMRQRVPCCWKWHSSELHRSILGSAARRRSFFKDSLGCRVGLGNERTGLAQPKPHLAEQALTLACPQGDLVALAQMFGQQFAIPQGLGKAELTRAAPQVAPHALPVGIGQTAWSSGALAFLKARKPNFLEAADPALYRTLALAEPQRCLSRTCVFQAIVDGVSA